MLTKPLKERWKAERLHEYIQGPIYIGQGGARRGLDWARRGTGQGGA